MIAKEERHEPAEASTAPADDVISLPSTLADSSSYVQIPSRVPSCGSLITMPESSTGFTEVDLSSSDTDDEGFRHIKKYGPSGEDPAPKRKADDQPPLPPAGEPIAYGPERPYSADESTQPVQTPQRPESPPTLLASTDPLFQPVPPRVEKKVRLEPSTDQATDRPARVLSAGVTFQSEYEKDIADGWVPVHQKGFIVAMRRVYEKNPGIWEEETKVPGHGNPLPPRRTRSLSINREEDRSAPASPVFDRQTDVFEYPEGCQPAPIRTERSNRPPPEPIKDVEIRPGEWLYLKRSQGRRTIWEPELTGAAQKEKPFLDWSGDRIVPCDSCRKHIAPVCSRCQVSTCFTCAKNLESWKSQDKLRATSQYMVRCVCSHDYKRNRDRSPFTNEATDRAWQASGGHRSHQIHPGIGMLSSPCGRFGPSRKHPDNPPRRVSSILFPNGWQDSPIPELCEDAPVTKSQRRRSRSPPRQRQQNQGSYTGRYGDAPWRKDTDLRPAAGAVILKSRENEPSGEAVRLDPNDVFPNLVRRAQSAPRLLESNQRPPSPQRRKDRSVGSRKREPSASYQAIKAKKRVVLDEVLPDERRQGLLNLHKNTGEQHVKGRPCHL